MKRIIRGVRNSLRSPAAPFLIAPSANRLLDSLDTAASFATGRNPVIVSFGTRDGVYDAYAERLAAACVAHGVASSIETIPKCIPDNAYIFKPSFIKWKLLTLGNPILWVDADAVVSGPIELPEDGWDVGFLQNNLVDKYGLNEVASLCIAFRPTVSSLRFLEHWEQFCAAHWMKPGHDHRKLNYTRKIFEGLFMELDLTDIVRGKLTRDVGKTKESAF